MNWLRLYHSTLTDPKVQELEPPIFKLWINLLVCASANEPRGVLPPPSRLKYLLRWRHDRLITACERLVNLQLLDRTESNTGYSIHNWDDWQYGSDDVNKRVSKYRERQRNVAGNVAQNVACNGNVTALDTDTDTDKETNKESHLKTQKPRPPKVDPELEALAEKIRSRHPVADRRGSKAEVIKTIKAIFARVAKSEREGLAAALDTGHERACTSEDWTKENGRYVPGLCRWLHGYADNWVPVKPMGHGIAFAEQPRKRLIITDRGYELG